MLRTLRRNAVANRPHELPAPPAYLTLRGGLIALLAAIVLCWPMLAVNGPLFYADTAGYYSTGEKIFEIIGKRLEPTGDAASPASPATSSAANESGLQGIKLRSIPYSIYMFLASATPLGLILACLLQGVAVLLMYFALVPRLDAAGKRRAAIGFVLLAACTSLPWFVSYGMPDILAASVVVFYLVMLRRIDAMTWGQRILIAALATAAVLAHYGHIPLAGALAILIVAWRWFEKSLKPVVVVLSFAPVVLAAVFNFGAGKLSTGDGSIAPARFPILLARSLEDGPARWYLEDACPQAGYAMCELSETIPTNVGAFLWSDQGFRRATDAQVEAIRNEESEILLEAFKRYPMAQTKALFGNAALQSVTLGTGEMWISAEGRRSLDPGTLGGGKAAKSDRTLLLFDTVIPVFTWISAAILVVLTFRGRLSRDMTLLFAFIVAALVINAAIFGGLSAPVDRYQSRIVWLLPALLALRFAVGRRDEGRDVIHRQGNTKFRNFAS